MSVDFSARESLGLTLGNRSVERIGLTADLPGIELNVGRSENEQVEVSEEMVQEEESSIKTIPKIKSRLSGCCIAKEYYSEYTNMVDSLHISPRLIVHKKAFKKNHFYSLTLNVRNNGLYPRLVKVTTDSPEDTNIVIFESDLHRYLETDETLEVKISIHSTTSHDINRRRHIFIESFHPNIIFQVPIIVLEKLEEPSICESIVMPASVPRNKSYYELLMYNPTKQPVKVRFRNTFRGLTLSDVYNGVIPKKDYGKLLLTFAPKKLELYRGFFNVKFNMGSPRMVFFEYTPKSMAVHLSMGYLRFGLSKFQVEKHRTFLVCNESRHDISMTWKLLEEKQTEPLSKLSQSERSVLSDSSRRLAQDSVSMHSALLYNFDDPNKPPEVEFDAQASKHFNIDAPRLLGPMSSNEIQIFFSPKYDEERLFDDDMDPPFYLCTKATFCVTDAEDCIESHFVVLKGEVAGVEVEIYPKSIDFRKIYLGEEHCAHIKILNVDSMNARVKFKDFLDPSLGGVRVTPDEGFDLEPCTRGIFNLSFYTIMTSRFTVVLRFKVDNGAHYKVLVNGIGQYVQLRTFPQLVEFGSIPITVPQKRYMLLMNPLAVPITLQVHATEDGEEEPLVLNIRDATEMLPITVRDPIIHMQKVHEDLRYKSDLINNITLTNEAVDDTQSMKSYEVNESIYSAAFEEDIMEPAPGMANRLLAVLKKQKIFDKSETDKRVIQEALTELLNTKYFSIFTKHNNFIFMDWNFLPSDPKEIYCDNEIIYLRPNTGRSITILIIPNKVGYFHRSLTVRVCPAVLKETPESSDDAIAKTLIKSEYLCSKLWFEYNCCIPEIEWNNYVDLTNRIIYAGEEYDFDIVFVNMSNVCGFVHFDVVPNEMSFRNGTWKYYIGSGSEISAKCSIVFRTLERVKLSGLIKIVGYSRPFPFHVIANVLPTEIRIYPTYVHQRLQVFELSKIHFYIDNVTPTNTTLTMKLNETKYQHLTVRGGILAATGQSMYTTLVSIFPDPDIYPNTLYIDLQFDHIKEIPITFLVEGVPLYFEPNIREGFDAGLLQTDTKENFNQNLFKYNFPVNVINRGERPYRVVIKRLKTYNNLMKSCTATWVSARFDIVPKILHMAPKSDDWIDILVTGFEPGTYYAEFILEVTDLKYPQRKYVIRITTQATFVDCHLNWKPKILYFNYQQCFPLKERSYIETPEILNLENIFVSDILLEATGPFRIKELFEHQFQRKIIISLNPRERKQIFVLLHKATLKQYFCKQVDGRLNVSILGKEQKSLPIKVMILVPEVQIIQPELVLFARRQPFDSNVDILNVGCTTASYKWKRLEVSEQYVGDREDPQDFVAGLLSEILRMLEYNVTCDDEPNMTLRYQQCRCQYHQLTESGNLVMDILEEIINDLDLEHRRYIIRMDERMNVTTAMDNSDLHSSSSFVHHTIYDILDRLNIESSQQVSEPSSEYCFSDRFIYFYDKTGELPGREERSCLIHLPYIRRSHELRTRFELSIVGGRSQFINITLVHLIEKIRFNKDNIYLGIKPWYETFQTVVRLTNMTKYELQLIVAELKRAKESKRLLEGYAKLQQSDTQLEPLGQGQIKISGILGFSECFVRNFGVVINYSAHKYFKLRGQGVLPILEMFSSLPQLEQTLAAIIDEYKFLQRIYNYEMFKSITEVDEDSKPAICEEEGPAEADTDSEDFSELSLSEEDMPSERQRYHDLQLFRMMKTYLLVNNNQELPNPIVLKQLLLTERYLQRLEHTPTLYATHQQVYQTYAKSQGLPGYRLQGNIKHFTVQPLPCEQHGFLIDLGPLRLNTLRRFEFKLHFFGPGKLIAAARTAVRIPGLYLDFLVDKHEDKKFMYWAEKCLTPEYFKEKYRNMFERVLDEQSPRLKHAHSFDIDEFERHRRDLKKKDRHLIDEYYDSLQLSVYPDHKHHYMLAKIFTACQSNFSGVDVRVVGLYKPESKYYDKGQLLEDYIYIDLHMGPTLPILLRGVFN